jgi:hypothetical protein
MQNKENESAHYRANRSRTVWMVALINCMTERTWIDLSDKNPKTAQEAEEFADRIETNKRQAPREASAGERTGRASIPRKIEKDSHSPRLRAIRCSYGASRTTVNLKWDNVPEATGYEIMRSTDGISYTNIKAGTFLLPRFVDMAVSGNGQYYYKVRSILDNGENGKNRIRSKPSNTLAIALVEERTTFHIVEVQITEAGIQLNWTFQADAREYILYRKVYGEKEMEKIASIEQRCNYVDADIIAGKRYGYQVECQYRSGKIWRTKEICIENC